MNSAISESHNSFSKVSSRCRVGLAAFLTGFNHAALRAIPAKFANLCLENSPRFSAVMALGRVLAPALLKACVHHKPATDGVAFTAELT